MSDNQDQRSSEVEQDQDRAEEQRRDDASQESGTRDDSVNVDSAERAAFEKKMREQNRENQSLRKRLKSHDSELSSVVDERDSAVRERDSAVHRLAQFEAALEAGLDPKLAVRLQGESAEELAEDAKKLAELFAGRGVVPGAFPSDGVRRGDVGPSEDTTDLSEIGARMFRR